MSWLRRKHRERELDRELRSHLELEAEEQRENGLTAEQSGWAARRALGNTAQIQEATREVWGGLWLDRLIQDLRYGCRSLLNSPGFAAVAILTVALGIGANTSIFSLVYTVLLRALPYPDSGRLAWLDNHDKDRSIRLGVGDFQYAAWREQSTAFDGIAAYATRRFTITGRGEPEQLHAMAVTPGFMRALGAPPLIGRDFSESDAAPRGGRVALITHSLWTHRFGADRSVLSQTMILDGNGYSIAGVLPQSFEFPGDPAVGVLVALSEPASNPAGPVYFYSVLARLKGGVTLRRAVSDLQVINQRLESAFPKRARFINETRITTLQEQLVGNVKPPLVALAGAVGFVLLIVCVNVSNLLLARAIARQKEITIRIALGAGRARVFRQLLTEGVLLSTLGGAVGLALAFGGVKLLRAIAPAGAPHIEQVSVGAVVLAFNLAIALSTGILFGVAPLRLVAPWILKPRSNRPAGRQLARANTGGWRTRSSYARWLSPSSCWPAPDC